MSDHTSLLVHHRVGGWLPKDHTVVRNYIDDILKKTRENPDKALAPCIIALKDLIEDRKNHLDIWIGFHQMFDEIPNKYPYTLNSMKTGKQIRDYKEMLKVFNEILTTPPKFENNDLVAFPINAILDWPMGTASGYSMFLDKDVNAKLGAILTAYGEFLKDEEANSNTVLIPHEGYMADPHPPNVMFYDLYKCPNKNAAHYGFRSFDGWFTREFNDVKRWRPVADPTDNRVISSACESEVYRIQYAKQNDTFWLKGQPYSLQDMLYDDELAPKFGNGLVYQAFLSASKYHRWNSPVNGRIMKVVQVPGYPYVKSYYEGFANITASGEPDPDPAATDRSQSFITSVATRAVVFIDADDPAIGLMCFIAVGMSEVSSCPVHVKWKKGVPIKKGDELGMFHFGGSTHCLIFREGVNIDFCVKEKEPVLINAKIGKVIKT